MPRLDRILAVLVVVLAARPALAQGLPDVRSGVIRPVTPTAAVDDAYALEVNPAGLAYVDRFVLQGGWVGRIVENRHDASAALAFGVLDGIGVSGGTGLVVAPAQNPLLRGSVGAAARVGRAFALGTSVHALQPLVPGGRTDLRFDVGTQVRPARFLALGATLEGLGARAPAAPSLRTGVAIRPYEEWVTLGLEARVAAGAPAPFSSAFLEQATVQPAATLRVDVGGVGVLAGASLGPVGLVAAGLPSWQAALGVEVNAEHLGATLLGGGGSPAAGVAGGADFAAGAHARLSGAAWPSVFPVGRDWLAIRLVGEGVPPDDDPSLLDALFGERPSAEMVLAALDNAAEDDDVEGVVLLVRDLSMGWGPAAELRSAILRLRAAGKKVVFHMDHGADVEMYVASAADKVYLSPAGMLGFDGLSVVLTYFGEALSRLGIGVQAVTAGDFKTAPRTFTADAPSEEELVVQNAILDGIFGALVEAVAQGRGLPVETVRAIVDLGGLSPEEALEKRLVDGLAYDDELEDLLEPFAGHPVRLQERDLLDDDDRVVRWDDPPTVALVPITGQITMGRSDPGVPGLTSISAGAQDIVDAIDAAREDPAVKAIVLRIDSPGGDALASDLIWHAVMRAREEKPVVASMGEVAASGGYYVAAGAQEIFAEPQTITGSIGVFTLLFDVEGLASDFGVSTYELRRGALPGPSIFRRLTEEERQRLDAQVEATYERFLQAVARGRDMDVEAIRKVAEGRVWLGVQAEQIDLVDTLGGVMDALRRARSLAGLREDEAVILSVRTGRDGMLPGLLSLSTLVADADPRARLTRAVAAVLGDPASAVEALEQQGRPAARLPWRITIE